MNPQEPDTMKKDRKNLRWGYSTGACAAAAAKAAWIRLTRGGAPQSIWVHFLDGRERELPLLQSGAGHMAAIRKNGGDDPDCTHGATLYADIRACLSGEIRAEDYVLQIGNGTLILRGAEGIGLCNRRGLDCELGRWAINTGPRNMISENLRRAGFSSGCWLLEIGVENGEELAKHTLNSHLGIMGGISLLGTTGLVRPYSHEAYIHTVRICVKSHFLSGGSTMVFCTGGRTKSGAEIHLPQLPATAFVRSPWPACPGSSASTLPDSKTRTRTRSAKIWICSAPKSAGRSPPRRACMEHSSTALPCARRFCRSPRTPGTASSAALRGPPSGNSRAAAQVTRPSACSCSILKEGSSLKKRGEGPKSPLPGSPQPSRRNRTNT